MRYFQAITLLLLMVFSPQAQAQMTEYWVYFEAKEHAESWLKEGRVALSDRALEKRFLRGIPLDAKDVAVWPEHVERIQSMGAQLLGTSRWMNAAVVRWEGPTEPLATLPFVKKLEPVRYWMSGLAEGQGIQSLNYGNSRNQIELMEGDFLHDQGFTGAGMRIAVLDAGFGNTNIIEAFDSLLTQGRLVDTRDFVNGDNNVYDGGGTHGTAVLSTMAANVSGVLVGTAPHAEYALYTTENVVSETRQEEYNWLFGAERADSLGCDIINSSLGYYEFDNPNDNYTYEDLDGNTTVVSRAADWAASRGLLVVCSAGNEGFGAWGRIVSPCDGDSVFCIGGVSLTGNYVPFSSRGPSADGRVKPNVVAAAASVQVVNTSNIPTPANGTSFSSPLIAGMLACVWQKYPSKSNWEIMRAVEAIGHNALTPDSLVGYGLPNFAQIDGVLSTEEPSLQSLEIKVFPNPSSGTIQFNCQDCGRQLRWSLMDFTGKQLGQGEIASNVSLQLPAVNGVFMLRIESANQVAFKRILIE